MENDNMRSTEEVCEAVRELGDALERVGITLPSLGLDAVTLGVEPPRAPLVDLGRCPADTARQLTEALLKVYADCAPDPTGPVDLLCPVGSSGPAGSVDARHGSERGRG
ncbi:hypothetical protein ABZ990_13915 [Streptomyces sp. NPDC046203]|uniref:hypothetical protein n=1 Tax=Streptomyces sp. NPDC046203 TaxID=3154602 RepID=UPI0033D1DF7D